jgi:NADH-quinone oxidoreductase subunit H
MLAGWSSNNKFSLLGAARAASQMISYEVSMGLALISLVVTYGTLDLNEMVRAQSGLIFGALPAWGIFQQPLAFVLFLTAAIAENKRVPFDLPECESELVAGYFTEYSAMKMGLFMLSEFIEIVIVSALLVTLFLGGYNLPWLTDGGFTLPAGAGLSLPHLAVVALQVPTFLVKVLLMGCFQIQIRWSLPRFRYDQLMRFGWKFLLPLAALNLVVTAVVRWWTT